MEMRARLWEAVPFSVMVLMEACAVGLTIMTKTVMANGMSPFVFVVYSNALSSVILLPYSLIFRSTQQSFFTFPLLIRFFFLGLTGFSGTYRISSDLRLIADSTHRWTTGLLHPLPVGLLQETAFKFTSALYKITIAQIFAFAGLNYTSPILSCGISHLIPAFSFLLALVLRTTKLDWKSTSGQAKIIGTLISITGGTLMIVYRGSVVKKTAFSSPYYHLQLIPRLFIFSSTPEYWVLGGLLFVVASLSASIWGIIQVGTIKLYREPMTIAALYGLMGTIQSTVVGVVAERDPRAWKLELNVELLLIFLSAIFGSIIRSRVHIWCIQNKGPFYVPLFKPVGIIVASIASAVFFGTSLHYGSLVGAYVIGIGYYTLMWGQIREDDKKTSGEGMDEQKVPLLQEEEQV